MSRADRERWEGSYEEPAAEAGPAAFLVEHAAWLPPGRVLDCAAGAGGNARFLAALGRRVIALDVARAPLRRLRAADPGIACVQMDLDAPGIAPGSLDGVVVTSFLDRRLFEPVASWLRPGGMLIWDTFLLEQRAIGHPRNPDYLLRRGELAARVALTCDVLVVREGFVAQPGGGAFRSGIVARRRSAQQRA